MSKVDLIVVGVSGLVISVSPGKRVGDVTGRRDNEIFARGTRRLAVSAIIQNVFFEWPPDRGNIICAEGAIMGPIIHAGGDCSQPHFNHGRARLNLPPAPDVGQFPDCRPSGHNRAFT